MSTPSAGTPAKVGACRSCGTSEAQFSKSQWKKPAGARRCIKCVRDTSQQEAAGNAQSNGNAAAKLAVAEKTKESAELTAVKAPAAESSDEESPGNWSPMQQSDDEVKRPSHKPTQSIREKMKRSRDDALNASKKRCKYDDHHDDNNVSVEQLKQQILGRSIHSYDVDIESQNFNGTGMIMDRSIFRDGATAADHLKPHLSCPVCFERLYNPVSLLCGHSFCKKCLMWWIDRGVKSEDYDDDTLQVFGTCPSCRNPVVGENKHNLFQINTALKACMDTLFGEEMNQRRLAEQRELKRATRAENGGAHNRGCEEIVSLAKEDEIAWGKNEMKDEENGWVSLYASSENGRRSTAYIRRNIILDDIDQQFQMSLAFTNCVISKGTNGCIVDAELCLLRMEEDEIDDSGFPTLVTDGSDDEALICTSNDRIHTCIESSARIASASLFEKKEFSFASQDTDEKNIREVPLSRGMLSPDGSVRFRIDIGRILEDEVRDETSTIKEPKLIKLIFTHVDTGARLEFRTPLKVATDDASDASDGEVEHGDKRRHGDRNKASKFVIDAYEEEEEDSDEANEYEMDDFVVDDSQDTDEEDGCDICNQHGELIVCDGGENESGCNKSFHLECINRSEVPPGDWICKDCSNEAGFDVGVEGHEYAVDESAIATDHNSNDVDLTDTPEKPKKKSMSKSEKETFDADESESEDEQFCGHSEEEETPIGHKKKSSKSKKQIIDLEDSDDD